MDKLPDIVLTVAFTCAGAAHVIGAARRWPWLVDPPEDAWFWNSQAFIKKVLGQRFLIYYTYALGLVLLGIGAYFLAKTVA